MLRWLLGGCAVILTLCSVPLAAQEPSWVLKVAHSSSVGASAYDTARGQVYNHTAARSRKRKS